MVKLRKENGEPVWINDENRELFNEFFDGTKTELKSREYTTTLGQVMKHFREQILNLTVPEMSRKIDIPATTLYNFENGNSTNANNIRYYFHLCKSQEQRKLFKQRIDEFNNDVLKVD